MIIPQVNVCNTVTSDREIYLNTAIFLLQIVDSQAKNQIQTSTSTKYAQIQTQNPIENRKINTKKNTLTNIHLLKETSFLKMLILSPEKTLINGCGGS